MHTARIRARIADELPFMATEALLVRAVERGGDRQRAHEVIRRHSVEVARAMKDEGARNDLFARLAADSEFGVPMDDIASAADASRFIGRAPAQVDEFLAEIVDPILASTTESTPSGDVRV